MRRAIVLTASLGALAALVVPAVSESAKAPKPPAKRTITIGVAPNPVTFGQPELIFGTVGGRNPAGVTVTLEQDGAPFDRYKVVGSTKTDAAGKYTFTRHPGRNTKYRVTAQGGGSPKGEALVNVKFRIRMSVSDKTPRRGQRVRFSGTVGPGVVFRLVRIQRHTSHGWVTAALAGTRPGPQKLAHYSTHAHIRHTGTYRAFIRFDCCHFSGFSSPLRLRIH